MYQTAIILLAAGESSRLGEPKQLLDLDGEPLVRRVARQLIDLEAGPIGVVVGARRDLIAAALGGLALTIVTNDDWLLGIGSSISAGMRWAEPLGVEAVMVVLCDQPEIDTAHLSRLLGRAAGEVDIVATGYAGSSGVPAIFRSTCYRRLLALDPNRGAKEVINDKRLKVERIENEVARMDLDTPDDVARWRAK